MAGGENTDSGDAGPYFTDDILFNILLWLPIAACIARFRCVCRSWRKFLSDPEIIRKIILSPISDDRKSFQLLVTGIQEFTGTAPTLCSVYSYETLRPISEEPITLFGCEEGYSYNSQAVLACCDGIFCIANTKRIQNGNYIHSVVLWNPATSEMKIVPPGPNYHPCRSSRVCLDVRAQRLGFGYDPKTDDYKIVRVLEFDEGDHDDHEYAYDPSEFYHGPTPLIFTEVYSLRNDSWKTLNVDTHLGEANFYETQVHQTIHLHQQWDTSRNEKCYWFRCKQNEGISAASAVISFDMSTEVFESINIPQPTGLAHYDGDDRVDYPDAIHYDRVGYYTFPNPTRLAQDDACLGKTWGWDVQSCFMLKDRVLMVTYWARWYQHIIDDLPNNETWLMLKYGDAESWTKLSTWPIRKFGCGGRLELWKSGTSICGFREMALFEVETAKRIRGNIEIEGTIGQFQAHLFTPTQVSISPPA